jgi:hypothetical protein
MVPLITSYAAPVLNSVTQTSAIAPGVYPTNGGTLLTIAGRGFGPSNATRVTVQYGTATYGPWTAVNVSVVSDSLITAYMGEGCGASLPVTVLVGSIAPASSTSSAPSSTMVSYSAPPNTYDPKGGTVRTWGEIHNSCSDAYSDV